MRLLNRLNQYQRLWQPSAGKPQTVTVSELARTLFLQRTPCSYAVASGTGGGMAGVAGAVRTRKARATTLSGHARIATQCDDGTGTGNRKAARCAGAGATGPRVSCALCYSRLWADNGKTIRPRYVFPTIARSNRYNRAFCPATCRAASRRTDIFRPDPLR